MMIKDGSCPICFAGQAQHYFTFSSPTNAKVSKKQIWFVWFSDIYQKHRIYHERLTLPAVIGRGRVAQAALHKSESLVAAIELAAGRLAGNMTRIKNIILHIAAEYHLVRELCQRSIFFFFFLSRKIVFHFKSWVDMEETSKQTTQQSDSRPTWTAINALRDFFWFIFFLNHVKSSSLPKAQLVALIITSCCCQGVWCPPSPAFTEPEWVPAACVSLECFRVTAQQHLETQIWQSKYIFMSKCDHRCSPAKLLTVINIMIGLSFGLPWTLWKQIPIWAPQEETFWGS